MLQRVLRDFIDFPKYLKREANRRRAADSVRIVGKPETTTSLVKQMLFGLSNILKHETREGRQESRTADQEGTAFHLSEKIALTG